MNWVHELPNCWRAYFEEGGHLTVYCAPPSVGRWWWIILDSHGRSVLEGDRPYKTAEIAKGQATRACRKRGLL